MSLADVYNDKYANGGSAAGGEAEKTAEEKKIAEILSKFSEDDCKKLNAASDLLDAFGVEAEDGPTKIAQAGQVVDHFMQEVLEDGKGGETASNEDSEKLAVEYEAAGRIMARAFHDESSKLAGQNGGGSETPSFSDRVAAALK